MSHKVFHLPACFHRESVLGTRIFSEVPSISFHVLNQTCVIRPSTPWTTSAYGMSMNTENAYSIRNFFSRFFLMSCKAEAIFGSKTTVSSSGALAGADTALIRTHSDSELELTKTTFGCDNFGCDRSPWSTEKLGLYSTRGASVAKDRIIIGIYGAGLESSPHVSPSSNNADPTKKRTTKTNTTASMQWN